MFRIFPGLTWKDSSMHPLFLMGDTFCEGVSARSYTTCVLCTALGLSVDDLYCTLRGDLEA